MALYPENPAETEKNVGFSAWSQTVKASEQTVYRTVVFMGTAVAHRYQNSGGS